MTYFLMTTPKLPSLYVRFYSFLLACHRSQHWARMSSIPASQNCKSVACQSTQNHSPATAGQLSSLYVRSQLFCHPSQYWARTWSGAMRQNYKSVACPSTQSRCLVTAALGQAATKPVQVELKNVTTTVVKPSRKSKHLPVLESSILDDPLTDCFVSFLFCYRYEKDSVHGTSELAHVLQKSLGEVLVPFFPFAGRWVRKSKGTSSRELQCTDEGVPFIEADVDEDMDSVVNVDNFEAEPLLAGWKLQGLDGTVNLQTVASPLPSLFVQMTRFKCGGVAINAAFCHQTADGTGILTFLQAWSQIAMEGKTSIIPIHDRKLLQSIFPRQEAEAPEQNSLQSILRPGQVEAFTADGVENKNALPVRKPNNPATFKTMHVKKQVIEQLKSEATMNNFEKVTTVDFITAHLWRSIVSTIEAIDKTQFPLMCTAVNGRKRLVDPTVPEHYSGNALVMTSFPYITGEELSAKPHLFAARLVHDGVAMATTKSQSWHTALKEFSTQVATMPSDCGRCETSGPRSRPLIAVTSCFRFPLYKIDFGCGEPVFASFNNNYLSLPVAIASTIIIHPPPPGRSKDTTATLVIVVQKTIAQALFSNKEFLSFFH